MRHINPINRRALAVPAAALVIGAVAFATAPAVFAEDSIYVPLFTYRTGPFAGSGIPVADGMDDYLEMLNQRDVGIGGVKLVIEECETGYDTKKGIECYEAVKGKHPVMVNPWSTGITLQAARGCSRSMIPPDGFRGVGREWRLTRLMPATTTRSSSRRTRVIFPGLPLSLPLMTTTLSPFRMRAAITPPPARAR